MAAEYAPQLVIKGFGGPLEEAFEGAYLDSLEKYAEAGRRGDAYGSAQTVTGAPPRCASEWAYRHPTFGDYEPSYLADHYFHADSVFGPPVAYHEEADHLFWLVSDSSRWLPVRLREILVDGMRTSTRVWPWGFQEQGDIERPWPSFGMLAEALYQASRNSEFEWTQDGLQDLLGRAKAAKESLDLPESASELADRFRAARFAEGRVQRIRSIDR